MQKSRSPSDGDPHSQDREGYPPIEPAYPQPEIEEDEGVGGDMGFDGQGDRGLIVVAEGQGEVYPRIGEAIEGHPEAT